MTHGRCITIYGLVIILISLTSCAGTKLTRTYVNPQYRAKPVTNILVIGIADKERHRRLFESSFVERLEAAGVSATASVDSLPLPADLKLDKSDILDAVRTQANDAVILTHVVGIETEDTSVRHGGSRSNFYEYYGARYDEIRDEGFARTKTVVRLETCLYDVKTEHLIWSGLSQTVKRDSVGQLIDEVVQTVIRELRKNKLISSK